MNGGDAPPWRRAKQSHRITRAIKLSSAFCHVLKDVAVSERCLITNLRLIEIILNSYIPTFVQVSKTSSFWSTSFCRTGCISSKSPTISWSHNSLSIFSYASFFVEYCCNGSRSQKNKISKSSFDPISTW